MANGQSQPVHVPQPKASQGVAMPAEALPRDPSPGRTKHPSRRAAKRIPVPLYAPNLLGYARIGLAFVGLYYAMIPITTSFDPVGSSSNELASAYPGQGAGRAVQIWILSASLDLLDGPLARRLDQCSKFGVLLDVLADNVLRTATWIATAVAAVTVTVKASASDTTEDRAAHSIHSIAIVLVAGGLVCLEWTTMLCTQLKSVADGKHWKLHHNGSNQTTSNGGSKSSSSADAALFLEDPPVPALVTAIFRDNFRSPLGVLSMYGMFSAGLWTYGSYFDRLRESLPLFEMWWALAVLGRVISLRVEIWLCWSYLRIVLAVDEDERRRRDDDKCQ